MFSLFVTNQYNMLICFKTNLYPHTFIVNLYCIIIILKNSVCSVFLYTHNATVPVIAYIKKKNRLCIITTIITTNVTR